MAADEMSETVSEYPAADDENENRAADEKDKNQNADKMNKRQTAAEQNQKQTADMPGMTALIHQMVDDKSKKSSPENHQTVHNQAADSPDNAASRDDNIIQPPVEECRRRVDQERRAAAAAEDLPAQCPSQHLLRTSSTSRREVHISWEDELAEAWTSPDTATLLYRHHTQHAEPVLDREQNSSTPSPGILRAMWDFHVLPFTTTWSILQFFHTDETPWHRLQQLHLPEKAASIPAILPVYISAEDLDRIEAQSGPPLVVTNRKAKTSWSRTATMNAATAILAAALAGGIVCGAVCTSHAYQYHSSLSSGMDATRPAIRNTSLICIAPAQSATDDLQTYLFKTIYSTAMGYHSGPDSTHLPRIIAAAEASLSSESPSSTSNAFHQAVTRIAQAETLLLPIDKAILLGANPPANTTADKFIEVDTSLHAEAHGYEEDWGSERNRDHVAIHQVVPWHMDLHGSTCLRLALQSSRRLRTEVLGIQPRGVSL